MGPRAERMMAIDLAMESGAHREWVEKERAKVHRVDRDWTRRARTSAASEVNRLARVVTEAEQDLATLHRDFRRLVREGASGRLLARQYDAMYQELCARQDATERKLAEAREAIPRVEEILADPVEHMDNLYARYPSLQRPAY